VTATVASADANHGAKARLQFPTGARKATFCRTLPPVALVPAPSAPSPVDTGKVIFGAPRKPVTYGPA